MSSSIYISVLDSLTIDCISAGTIRQIMLDKMYAYHRIEILPTKPNISLKFGQIVPHTHCFVTCYYSRSHI